MKGKKWKKMFLFSLLGVFLSLLLSFGLSGNVSAVSISTLNNFSYSEQRNLSSFYRVNVGNVSVGYTPFIADTILPTQWAVNDLQSSFSITPESGQAYELHVTVNYYAWNTSTHYVDGRICSGLTATLIPQQGSPLNSSSIVESCVIKSNNQAEIKLKGTGYFQTSTSISSIYWDIQNSDNNLAFCSNYAQASAPGCSNSILMGISLYDFSITMSQDPNTGILNEQLQLQQQQQQQEQQDRQDIEQGQQDAQDSGDSASSDASNVGQSLFSAFSSLLTALLGVHKTNCKLPDFDINGIEFTNMDLCIVSVPSGISALGSLMIVFMIVPMGINCAKRMLALYNELLGGK